MFLDVRFHLLEAVLFFSVRSHLDRKSVCDAPRHMRKYDHKRGVDWMERLWREPIRELGTKSIAGGHKILILSYGVLRFKWFSRLLFNKD